LPTAASAQTDADNTFGDDAQVSRDIEEILAGPISALRVEATAPQEKPRPKCRNGFEKVLPLARGTVSRAGGAFSALGLLLQGLAYGVLAAICALIIWLVVRAVNRYRERHTSGLAGRRSMRKGRRKFPLATFRPMSISSGRRNWLRKGSSGRRSRI